MSRPERANTIHTMSGRPTHSRPNSISITFSPTRTQSPPFPMSPTFATDQGNGAVKELEDVQERTFCKWLNAKLEFRGIAPMSDLGKDLSDGVKLIQLMEIMGNTSLGRYSLKPRLRVQKAENVVKALDFIRSRGVVLTNIGPEDIIDGNRKLILGMIWTLILRFTIADINEEGLTAKEGLLLWCQRKTQGYQEVDIQNFSDSWKDGLALCALINRHRPDLLNYAQLHKNNAHENTRLAFQIADKYLGIPQLLEVSDLCNAQRPDERSVMTYVAQFFHAFSSMNKTETEARRVAAFAEHMQSVWLSMNDYERRMSELLNSIRTLLGDWAQNPPLPPYSALKIKQAEFHEHKKTKKRNWVEQKTEVVNLLGNIGVKLKTYNLRDYRPPEGVRLSDMDALWEEMLQAEKGRSREINAKIRQIKEELRKQFAQLANSCEANIYRISEEIIALEGSLDSQLVRVKGLQARLPLIQDQLIEISAVEKQCIEANVEENDYTVYTYEDLEFELGLVQKSVTKKIAFIENQVVSRSMTNLTPAQLEEFESTFRYFDKDETNTLDLNEFQAALASLSIVYSDAEIDEIHQRLGNEEGRVTFEAFISFLVSITEDTKSSDQVRASFRGIAGEKPYVTELDLRLAMVPEQVIEYLKESMPQLEVDGTKDIPEGQDGVILDFETYLSSLFI